MAALSVDEGPYDMLPSEILTLGWREWVGLPQLGLPSVKAKVDTGARTSTLHAFELRPFEDNGQHKVEFKIHPQQKNTDLVVTCVADIIDERPVTDSGGHREQRWVISTPLTIGPYTWPIEMTLTSRDSMLFRMLLGRTAMHGLAVVNPCKSYLVGKKPRRIKC